MKTQQLEDVDLARSAVSSTGEIVAAKWTPLLIHELGGGTRRGNNYVLDGVPITDLTNRAVANPSIESLDDIKVQVHTYDAEMGRTGGGVFNTTLKSGTNNWHGTGFFQTRPRWGAANNYFGGKAGQPKPETKYYLPGGGVEVAINDQAKGTLGAKPFADALFACWIGPHPGPGDAFREALMGNAK